MSIHQDIQSGIAELLRADEELSAAGCTVIEQNGPELAAEIQKELGSLDGPVLVVCVDEVRLQTTHPRQYEVDVSIDVTEVVVHNRERGGFLTAIDCAMRAGEIADGLFGNFRSVSHSTPGGGVLEAVAKITGKFQTVEQGG